MVVLYIQRPIDACILKITILIRMRLFVIHKKNNVPEGSYPWFWGSWYALARQKNESCDFRDHAMDFANTIFLNFLMIFVEGLICPNMTEEFYLAIILLCFTTIVDLAVQNSTIWIAGGNNQKYIFIGHPWIYASNTHLAMIKIWRFTFFTQKMAFLATDVTNFVELNKIICDFFWQSARLV